MILPLINQALIALPLVVGAYITISLLKLPDFSLESAYLFGGVMAYVAEALPLPFVILSAIAGGALVGAFVSTLSQCLRLPFLLAAIIANGFFHGLTQFVLGTSLKSFHPPLFLSENCFFALTAAGLCCLMFFVFRSQFGYSLAICGNNPHFFQHHPVSGRYVNYVGIISGHGCAGLAGFLFALSNGFVDLTMNVGVILLCLTALILGKSITRTHRPTLSTPLVGLLAFFCLQQTIIHMGLNLKYFNSFQALCILGVLLLLRQKKKEFGDLLGV